MPNNQISTDEKYMRRCIQLARNGMQNAKPNPMVGAVITVPDPSSGGERIIGEGYHIRCGEGHAEVNAFASVNPEDEHLLPQATIYVSLEPCSHYGKTPPCADLIISKHVRRVVAGCIDPFAEVQGRGIAKIREAGIDVTVGVLEEECRDINRRFFTFHSLRRPYILLKWARSADGFLDDHYHACRISTDYTSMLAHKLRAEYDAIVVGRITDDRDHSRLNVRHWSGRDPLRFVLSSSSYPSVDDFLDELYEKKVQSLIVEGGAKTLQSFISCGKYDEIRVEEAPIILGEGTPAPSLPKEIRMISQQSFDGNIIRLYRREKI